MAKCDKSQVDNARKVRFDGENFKSEENTMAPLGVPPTQMSRSLSDRIAELSQQLNDALSCQPHGKSNRRWICWFHSQYGFQARKCEKLKANNSCVPCIFYPKPYEGDNDSGVDESTQEKERNGPTSPVSPVKSPSKIPSLRRPESITPHSRSRSTSKQRLTAKTPETPTEPLIKKIPMNKIQVGATPSPNLKVVRSKIGSLENATHKPGGGNVKIETKKIEIKAGSRIEAKNEHYVPKGGDKKIITTKLQWNAKPKIGSLENATHKPGGGDKRIEVLKTDFKERARPKVGSKDNLGYQPGGGDVKIINQKLDIKAESKVGSLENVKHKPGGGDKKIFDDREYLKQIDHPIIPTPPSQSPVPEFDQNSYY